MGILGVLRGLFTGNTQVSEATHDAVVRLTQQVALLGREVEELEHALERLRDLSEDRYAQFSSFRGRVYAWKRFEPPPEQPEKAQELPLTDPKVTKAELRARLLQPGKPFKHTN